MIDPFSPFPSSGVAYMQWRITREIALFFFFFYIPLSCPPLFPFFSVSFRNRRNPHNIPPFFLDPNGILAVEPARVPLFSLFSTLAPFSRPRQGLNARPSLFFFLFERDKVDPGILPGRSLPLSFPFSTLLFLHGNEEQDAGNGLLFFLFFFPFLGTQLEEVSTSPASPFFSFSFSTFPFPQCSERAGSRLPTFVLIFFFPFPRGIMSGACKALYFPFFFLSQFPLWLARVVDRANYALNPYSFFFPVGQNPEQVSQWTFMSPTHPPTLSPLVSVPSSSLPLDFPN